MLPSNQACCGCGACEQVCPQKCITMAKDMEGFLRPEFTAEGCIGCRLCEKACPVVNVQQNDISKEPKAYAAYCNDAAIRSDSSSGGIFTLLAEEIIRRGGMAVGAAFDDDWSVHHVSVHSREELSVLRGSKYLQSRTENTFAETKQVLEQGRLVLYTGTPCEIEGLKAYLGKEYENLYTQDLICHGSPSSKLWRKYVCYRENRAGAPARRTFFRHKKYGWKTYALSLLFNNDKAYVQILGKDLYMQMFLQDICLRPSCYQCSFKKLNRVSDITLADFWGCDNVCPELNDDRGLSLVLVHSSKGKALLEACASRMKCTQVDAGKALCGNPSMTKSCVKPHCRDSFMRELDTSDISTLAKKYLKKQTVVSKIKQMIPARVKTSIKGYLGKLK